MRTNYGICIRVWVYRPMLRYICYYSTLMTAFLQAKKHRNTPQARLRPTSPSSLRDATSPSRGGFGSPRKVNGFARGSPTRGAVERSETERLYEGKPDREPLLDSTSPSALMRCHLPYRGEALTFRKVFLLSSKFSSHSIVICSPSSSARTSAPVAGRLRTR